MEREGVLRATRVVVHRLVGKPAPTGMRSEVDRTGRAGVRHGQVVAAHMLLWGRHGASVAVLRAVHGANFKARQIRERSHNVDQALEIVLSADGGPQELLRGGGGVDRHLRIEATGSELVREALAQGDGSLIRPRADVLPAVWIAL